MQLVKKKVTPRGVAYNVTLSIWAAVGIGVALLVFIALILT